MSCSLFSIMIHIKVYSILNCLDCKQYHKLLHHFCHLRDDVTFTIIDIDNEQNFREIMDNKLMYIPSTLVYKDNVLIGRAEKILTHIELFDLVYGLQ
jgi:glutaredoxin